MRFIVAALLALGPIASASAAANSQPIALPGDTLHPESVAIASGNVAYVGGMSGAVLRISLETGVVEQWLAPGTFGAGALFGVLADEKNGLLWTCTNDFSARGVKVEGAAAGTWLKAFDLSTREGKISLALPGPNPICNDMDVDEGGAVYIADTSNPRILRWTKDKSELEIWKEDPIFAGGLDGLAFGDDGNLYINNVRTGEFFRVAVGADGLAGEVTRLETSRPLVNPDGMRKIEGTAFALAEGGGKISRVEAKGDRLEVTTLADNVSNATGAAAADGKVWYVQGYLSALFNPQAPRPPLPFYLTPIAD